MKKQLILILCVLVLCVKSQPKDHGDTALSIKFDLKVYNSKEIVKDYYFEFNSPSMGITVKYKVDTSNLYCNLFYNEDYTFVFTYKNYKPVYIALNTDTIKSKRLTLPIRFNSE